MKRLVYSPSVNVWIKTDTGIFDLSSYVTGFTIHRTVNAVSTAEVTFRNPKVEQIDGVYRYAFTEHAAVDKNGDTVYQPMFHPMDPIIITLTRLKGHPVQVFTGYCDESPYVQLFPGTAKLTASCTLKRLLYTYWDPGLPTVLQYLGDNGWILTGSGTTINPNAEASEGKNLNDSSIGYLLYKILKDIGGWNDQDIFIQSLPSEQIGKIVSGIYQDLTGDAKASFKVFSDFLTNVIGTASYGGTNNPDPSSSGTIPTYNGKQGKLTPIEAKSAAKSMLKDFGWGDDQWASLEQLWEHESNWRWEAENTSSGAYGIPQALPASKMATYGSDYRTNAITQIKWGLNYIKERYKTPNKAWQFWQNPSNSPSGASTHWY